MQSAFLNSILNRESDIEAMLYFTDQFSNFLYDEIHMEVEE